jgi:hypothetical protein
MITTGVLKKFREDTWMLSSPESKPQWFSIGIEDILPLLAVVLGGIVMASFLLVFERTGVPPMKKLLLPRSKKRPRGKGVEFWHPKLG